MSQRQTKPALRRIIPNPQPPSPGQHTSPSQGSTPTYHQPQCQAGMPSEPNLDTFTTNQAFNHYLTPVAFSMGHEHATTLSSLDTSNLATEYQLNIMKQRLDSMEATITKLLLSNMANSHNFHPV